MSACNKWLLIAAGHSLSPAGRLATYGRLRQQWMQWPPPRVSHGVSISRSRAACCHSGVRPNCSARQSLAVARAAAKPPAGTQWDLSRAGRTSRKPRPAAGRERDDANETMRCQWNKEALCCAVMIICVGRISRRQVSPPPPHLGGRSAFGAPPRRPSAGLTLVAVAARLALISIARARRSADLIIIRRRRARPPPSSPVV